MLTDTFLNVCCSVLFTEHKKITDTVIDEIGQVLKFYDKKQVPLKFQKKYNLANVAYRLRSEGKRPSTILDSIQATGQFAELDHYLKQISTPSCSHIFEKIDDAVVQINSRKKLVVYLKDLPFIRTFLEQFDTNSFDNIEEFLNNYSILVSKMYSRVSEEKRHEANSQIRTLDCYADDYAAVLEQIVRSYSGENAISSGYLQLDEYINGGFEPSRLYIFGGASGDGKSVLLVNLIRNAVERPKPESTLKDVYIYITLENLIDESLIRLYSCVSDQDTKGIIKDIKREQHHIRPFLKEWQERNNSILSMCYFPPTVTSVADVLTYIDDVKNRYKGIGVVRGVYIDYLDLLKSGQTFDLHRLEMGQITIDLKVLAVQENIPIVTVTQLNRGGYDHKEMLSLTQMSESIKKVENADFVGLIRSMTDDSSKEDKTMEPINRFLIAIGKNRSGPKNKNISLISKFSRYRINDNSKTTSIPFIGDSLNSELVTDTVL